MHGEDEASRCCSGGRVHSGRFPAPCGMTLGNVDNGWKMICRYSQS